MKNAIQFKLRSTASNASFGNSRREKQTMTQKLAFGFMCVYFTV